MLRPRGLLEACRKFSGSPYIRATLIHGVLRATGPLRDFGLVYTFGAATFLADFYFLLGFQVAVIGMISSVITMGLVPHFVRYPGTFKKRAFRFFWMTQVLVVGSSIVISTYTSNLLRGALLVGLTVLPMAVSGILSARLISEGRLIRAFSPSLLTSLMPLTVIAFFPGRADLHVLCLLLLAGYVLEATSLLLLIGQESEVSVPNGEGIPISSDWVWLSLTAVLSLIWSTIDLLIIRSFGAESVVIFTMASRIPLGLASIALPAINTVLLPNLSHKIRTSSDLSKVWITEHKSISRMMRKVIVVLFLLSIVSTISVYYFFRSSDLTIDQNHLALVIQVILFASLAPYVYGTVLGRYLQLGGRMAHVALVTCSATCLNIFLDFVLSAAVGVAGVALATVITYTFTAFTYRRLLSKTLSMRSVTL